MTEGRGLLFYSVLDYLVFYTIYCTEAERQGIAVLALCPMPDHIHQALVVDGRQQLSAFVQQYSHKFAHAWNKSRGTKGEVFHHSFKSSVKMGNKQVRTILAYNYNNPVERKLVQAAEAYRWNLLAYYEHAHPFSAANHRPSAKLKAAMKEVSSYRKQCLYLGYGLLSRLYKPLSPLEQQVLTDYIVQLWNVVDYSSAIAYYGSYEVMVRAFHDNTGYEYDIKEDRDNYSDAVYQDCTAVLLRERMIADVFEIPGLPESKKWELFHMLRMRTTAQPKQLLKYLHLPLA